MTTKKKRAAAQRAAGHRPSISTFQIQQQSRPGREERLYRLAPVKRRATRAEMEERAEFLIDYAALTLRSRFDSSIIEPRSTGVPGIDKADTVIGRSRQVLELRRAGAMLVRAYSRRDPMDAEARLLQQRRGRARTTARLYKRSLWTDANSYVEVWCEEDAAAPG